MSARELAARAFRRVRLPLLYAALCTALILGLRERAWQHISSLNDDEWQPVQDLIRPHRRGQEPLCFLPSWTRGHATDEYKFRNVPLIERPADAWEGREDPLPGLWVVSQFGAFDPVEVPEEIYPHRQMREVGQADVWLFRSSPIESFPDSLVYHLRRASCVLHLDATRRIPMEWDRIGYSLPRGSALRQSHDYLGCRAAHDRFAGRARSGIWLHPPVKGQSVSVTWPEWEVRPWLAVGGGLRDQVASGRGSPVKLQVVLDGRTLGTYSFPAERGWRTFAVETGRPRGKARLAFKATTDQNHSRHFIFDAEMLSTRPQETPPPRALPGRPLPGKAPGAAAAPQRAEGARPVE